jgi:glycosyltransferase involved in cell wall biosynthesis
MYPEPSSPGFGIFVADQVEALREIPGVELELFTFASDGALSYVTAARRLRRLHRSRDFDVVHAHYGLSGWISLALGRCPRVVTFHGTDLHHSVVGRLSRVLARLIDVSAPVSASLARAGLANTAALPCGVNLERFLPRDRRQARRSLGLDPEGRYLLFAGDPRRKSKRFDRARAVAAELSNVDLLWLEGVAPDRVCDYVNAANAVVAPSEREGFGLAPIEALACDVPVAATPVGVAPVALHGVQGTLCAPFDAKRFADALRDHIRSSDPRIAGRRRAALFDRRRLAQRVVCAYTDLV